MRILSVAIIMTAAITAFADDLEDLKMASVRYVDAMKAALAFSDGADCSETIASANEYAAAKVAYYTAARQAMPALLEIAKGQGTTSRYGNELAEIFRGFGEGGTKRQLTLWKPNQADALLQTSGIKPAWPSSMQSKWAEQFVKDFNRLEGV